MHTTFLGLQYDYYGLVQLLSYPMLLGDCLTWNATIAIWNPKLSDQIGTLIDRFCPEISAKEYILNITARKIVIRLVYYVYNVDFAVTFV